MEITLNKIVAVLSERSGREFSIPFQEELKVIVNSWRSRLIANSLQKKPNDRKFFIQPIVVPLITVNKIDCPTPYGCIQRTTEKLPSILRVNSTIFDFVGTADFEDSFGVISDFYIPFIKYNRYTKFHKKYIYRGDGYLYIYNDKEIENIGIQAIFGDPSAAESINCNTGLSLEPCDIDDLPYPITQELLQPIIESILKTELRVILPIPKDEIKVDEH